MNKVYYCQFCAKHLKTEGRYNKHLGTKDHKRTRERTGKKGE